MVSAVESRRSLCASSISIDLVANIVGGFDEIHQRMARIANAIALMFEGGDTKGVENREKGVVFGREEAHFRLIACQSG